MADLLRAPGDDDDGRAGAAMGGSAVTRPAVLTIVENESVPMDVRVWAECQTLRRAGFDVVAICPQGRAWDRQLFECVDGIEIHRFPPSHSAGGIRGYAREYATAFWHVARLVRRVSRNRRFDVVHAHNPPDILLLAASPLRLRGSRFVFDHHDLVPELCATRFSGTGRLLIPIVRLLERLTFMLADVVIATNGSYAEVALGRGRKSADAVFVVRNGPHLANFRPTAPDPALKRGKQHLLAYVGNMAPQDGVDHAIRALAILRRRRHDWHAVFVGGGEVLPALQRLTATFGLGDSVEFAGRVAKERVPEYICSADVCLAPDPRSPYNDACTLIKIPEYMAMARPTVSYDLRESRVSAAGAALYAAPNDVESFADAIEALLDDPGRRAEMGRLGRERVEDQLAWEHSEPALLAAYAKVLAGAAREASPSSSAPAREAA
jgi:glycosyltransferase involved in cell wall biosynthesis